MAKGLFRGVARHTLVYGLGMIVGRLVSFLMLPVYTRYLTPADYGVLGLVEMSLDFITIIAGGRLVVGFYSLYHGADTEEERRRATATSFLLVSFLYAVVGGACVLAAPALSRLLFQGDAQVEVIRIAAVNVGAQSLSLMPFALARVRDRSMLAVVVNLLKLVLGLAGNILFVVGLGFGVKGVFLSSLIANLLTGVGLAAWLVRSSGVGFAPLLARRLLRFGVPLIATQMAAFVVTFGNRYFLNAAADEAAVGLYNLASTFGYLLVMVGYSPIDQAWGPKRFEVARGPEASALLARGFVLVNLVLLTVGVGIGLLVHDVIRIMAAPAFHAAAAVVPVILLAYVLESWAGMQDIGILVAGKTEYITAANLLSAVAALVAYAVLIPRYLGLGAAIATTIAFAVRWVFTYRWSQQLWPVTYRWRPVLLLAGWATGLVAGAVALPALPVLPSLVVRLALVVLYFAGLWWLPVLDGDDKALIVGIARERWRRALGGDTQTESSSS